MVLSPSEVRKQVLAEHANIRARLDELEALVAEPPRHHELAPAVLALTRQLFGHIAHEEKVLRPLLSQIDAWGELRVQVMDSEHQAQRATLQRLAALAAEQPPQAWAGELTALIAGLRSDMVGEENDCLHPNLLRDDTVTIDSFGG